MEATAPSSPTPIRSTTEPATPPRGAREAAAGGGSISSDFNTFVKLLTTELKQQDPLNPMDSSEFAVQLATFATVEQQALTNRRLDALAGTLAEQTNTGYAGWVGMRALAAAPALFDGTPVTAAPDIVGDAEAAVLVVRDSGGREVRRSALPLDAGRVQWPGLDQAGREVPPGTYTLRVESYAGGKRIADRPAQVFGGIAELRVAEDGPVLILDSGVGLAPDEITALAPPR